MRWLLASALACGGCFGSSDADLSGIEVALVAGSSIGHSASMTAAAMSAPVACVSVTQPCSATYPCSGVAAVTLGDACPLPLGGVGSGQIAVSGSWAATDMATLGMMLGIGVSDGKVAVSEAIGVKVTTSMGHQTVAYAGQDVSVSQGAALGQSSWTVDVDGKGTPGDPSDDVYTINGASQGAAAGSGAQVTQVSLTTVVLDPSCRKNPIAGMGVIQQVGSASLGEVVASFHAACDGKVDVAGALGSSHAQKLALFH
ncbi:MAG TPA: hypothetical protein VF997_18690 [Polyangia bacterium]